MGENKSEGWKNFLRKHWNIFALFVVAVVLAFVAAVYVFLWVVGNLQSLGLVPSTLGLWTMANMVDFLLHLVFWELVLIGIPVVLGAIVGWQWWKRLPNEEKREYRFFGKRSRTRSGGGGASLFFFIVFAIKVYLDGNWNSPVSTWTTDYVVGSMITILMWLAAIFGIPAAIALIWWVNHEIKRPPPPTESAKTTKPDLQENES